MHPIFQYQWDHFMHLKSLPILIFCLSLCSFADREPESTCAADQALAEHPKYAAQVKEEELRQHLLDVEEEREKKKQNWRETQENHKRQIKERREHVDREGPRFFGQIVEALHDEHGPETLHVLNLIRKNSAPLLLAENETGRFHGLSSYLPGIYFDGDHSMEEEIYRHFVFKYNDMYQYKFSKGPFEGWRIETSAGGYFPWHRVKIELIPPGYNPFWDNAMSIARYSLGIGSFAALLIALGNMTPA